MARPKSGPLGSARAILVLAEALTGYGNLKSLTKLARRSCVRAFDECPSRMAGCAVVGKRLSRLV